jgi:hypothetical protein
MPFEIKSHTAPGVDASKGLRAFMADLKIDQSFIIARNEEDYSLSNGVTVLSAKNLLADTAALARLGK